MVIPKKTCTMKHELKDGRITYRFKNIFLKSTSKNS